MSNKLCRQVIETALNTWAVARTPALPVAWENAPFSAPATTYLRAFLMPADTSGFDLAGAGRSYMGVYQVNVVAPINTGPGAAEGIAGEIAALFPLNTLLTAGSLTLQVVSPVSVAQGMTDGERYTVPAWFRYRANTI